MKQIVSDVSLAEGNILYMGEGNANLVVQIKDRGLVLRFPKSKSSEKCLEDKLNSIVSYLTYVIKPQLGDRFINPVSLLRISQADLQELKSRISESRPAERCVKDIFYPVGILMPDLTAPRAHVPLSHSGSILSVELKPKTGFLLPENCPHPTLCNFCLKQVYKVQTGTAERISGYCPLDLFSGDERRMVRALKELMSSPQNNLKIFGDGELLHTTETIFVDRCERFVCSMLGSTETLAEVLVSALLSEYQPNSVHHIHHTLRSGINSYSIENISSKKESESQENNCDTSSGCHPPFSCSRPYFSRISRPCRLCGELNACPRGKEADQWSEDAGPRLTPGSVLHSVFKLQEQNKITDHQALELLDALVKAGADLEDIQQLIVYPNTKNTSGICPDTIRQLRNYALYATAKDLSIFVTLTPESPHGETKPNPRIVINNQSFSFSIKIVDLDPKHVRRISKYVGRKEDWLNTCASNKHSRS